MAKKNEFIRIRVDEELKRALKEAAAREDRQEADQARHILRKALGLTQVQDERYEKKLGKSMSKTG